MWQKLKPEIIIGKVSYYVFWLSSNLNRGEEMSLKPGEEIPDNK